jgi:hypothetical protein
LKARKDKTEERELTTGWLRRFLKRNKLDYKLLAKSGKSKKKDVNL